MRSRIAMAAVAASLVAGLGACGSTSKPGAATPAPTSAAGSATASSGGGEASAANSSGTSSPGASSSATATEAGSPAEADGASGTLLATMRAKVAAVYGQGVTAAGGAQQPGVDSAELAQDFENADVMKAVWGSGAAGADRPLDCGMTKYNGVVIGAVKVADGGSATVPVALYQNAKPAGATAVTVSLDPKTGNIKGVACGGAAPTAAAFPGIAPLAAYYGATVGADLSVVDNPSKPYFTPAFAAWKPTDTNYDAQTCTQYAIDRWIVALTGTTSVSSQWDFAPSLVRTAADPSAPGAPTGFSDSVAVDLGSNKISRVTCGSAKPPVRAGMTPGAYAGALMSYYRLAADQKSLGVSAEAAIRPFFVSDAAFTQAWKGTGAVPLLCTNQVPGSVTAADGSAPATDGGQTKVNLVTWPDWHPGDPGQETSKLTVAFDAKTMKIAAITCTK